MIYRPQRIDFLDVVRGDTFLITFGISPAYEIKPDTRITMQVRPSGDIPEAAILTFNSDNDTINIEGQDVTFHQTASAMLVRPGKFIYDIQFTTDGNTNTLYYGPFEIIKDSTQI